MATYVAIAVCCVEVIVVLNEGMVGPPPLIAKMTVGVEAPAIAGADPPCPVEPWQPAQLAAYTCAVESAGVVTDAVFDAGERPPALKA